MNEHGVVLHGGVLPQLQLLPGLGLLGLLVAGLAVVLLASRPLALWYWRVDERVALLREVRDALRRLEEAPPVAPGPPPPPGAGPRRGEHAGHARRRPRGRWPARPRRRPPPLAVAGRSPAARRRRRRRAGAALR
jgi:hypothetical protein